MSVVLRKSEHAILVSIGEAAEKLGVHAATLRRMIERKKIPSYRIGRAWRLNVEEVLQTLKMEPNPCQNQPSRVASNSGAKRGTSTSHRSAGKDTASLVELLISRQQKSF